GVEFLRQRHTHLAIGARLDAPFFSVTNDRSGQTISGGAGRIAPQPAPPPSVYLAPLSLATRLQLSGRRPIGPDQQRGRGNDRAPARRAPFDLLRAAVSRTAPHVLSAPRASGSGATTPSFTPAPSPSLARVSRAHGGVTPSSGSRARSPSSRGSWGTSRCTWGARFGSR